MSVNCCSSLNSLNPQTPFSFLKSKKKNLNLGHLHFPQNSASSPFPKFKCQLHIGFEDIVTITQNKVLIAAGVSAAVGQLAKPFTSVLLYGKDFDAVVAAATSLALERGFSDSIFGMSAVYAGLVMYDAQGVRREVGNHARALNRLLMEDQMKSVMVNNADITDPSLRNLKISSFREETNAFSKEQTAATQLIGSRLQKITTESTKEIESSSYVPLKESIGHTEVEVIAGALLGFLVTLTVYAVM